MNGSVRLCPNSLRSRIELESKLTAYKLSLKGNWGVERLAQHLQQITRRITHLDRVHIEPPLSSPAALCVAGKEVLVCADDEQRAIIQVTLEKNGVKNGVNLHYGGNNIHEGCGT